MRVPSSLILPLPVGLDHASNVRQSELKIASIPARRESLQGAIFPHRRRASIPRLEAATPTFATGRCHLWRVRISPKRGR